MGSGLPPAFQSAIERMPRGIVFHCFSEVCCKIAHMEKAARPDEKPLINGCSLITFLCNRRLPADTIRFLEARPRWRSPGPWYPQITLPGPRIGAARKPLGLLFPAVMPFCCLRLRQRRQHPGAGSLLPGWNRRCAGIIVYLRPDRAPQDCCTTAACRRR